MRWGGRTPHKSRVMKQCPSRIGAAVFGFHLNRFGLNLGMSCKCIYHSLRCLLFVDVSAQKRKVFWKEALRDCTASLYKIGGMFVSTVRVRSGTWNNNINLQFEHIVTLVQHILVGKPQCHYLLRHVTCDVANGVQRFEKSDCEKPACSTNPKGLCRERGWSAVRMGISRFVSRIWNRQHGETTKTLEDMGTFSRGFS